MLFYLVQHAEAKKEEEDPARPLSEKGLQDIKKVASYLSGLRIEVSMLLHSGKLRAKQTAGVLAENLRRLKGISETEGLAPMDDPKIIEERLKGMTDSVMLVGHLPHLGRLASLFLCGDMNKNIVSFRMGGVVCLEREEKGEWSLRWMIIPEILLSSSAGLSGVAEIYAGDLGL